MVTQIVLQPHIRLPILISVARVKQIATWTTRKAENCAAVGAINACWLFAARHRFRGLKKQHKCWLTVDRWSGQKNISGPSNPTCMAVLQRPQGRTNSPQPQLRRNSFHRLNAERDVLFQIDAQIGRAVDDVITIHTATRAANFLESLPSLR